MPKNKKIKEKTIFLASDHAGFKLKEEIKKYLTKKRGLVLDLGTKDTNSVDYPEFAHRLSKKIKNNGKTLGVLVCGSGIGMEMAANRHRNVRAALCYSVRTAKLSREHNDANVITLGARLTNKKLAIKCISAFISTKFKRGRHLRRIKKI